MTTKGAQEQIQSMSEEEHTSFYLVSPMIFPPNVRSPIIAPARERIRIVSVREFGQSRIHSGYERVGVGTPGDDFASIIDLYIWVAQENHALDELSKRELPAL